VIQTPIWSHFVIVVAVISPNLDLVDVVVVKRFSGLEVTKIEPLILLKR